MNIKATNDKGLWYVFDFTHTLHCILLLHCLFKDIYIMLQCMAITVHVLKAKVHQNYCYSCCILANLIGNEFGNWC